DMNPTPRKAKEPKVDEPLPPDIDDMPGVSLRESILLKQLVEEHTVVGRAARELDERKKELTTKIKDIIANQPNLHKVICAGSLVSYYSTSRASISKEKLLGVGIQPDVIDKCTVNSQSWTLKIRSLDELADGKE
ncbi:MAG: hypothetical protein ACREJN_16210, partial [Nitrospiraceae bacterium]